MYRIRTAVLVGVALLAAAVLMFSTAGAEPPPKPRDDDTDNVVPVATSVQVLRNVELSVDGAKLNVSSVEYAQQGTTVYLLPVWVVARVETLGKTGSWEEAAPGLPLPTKAEGTAPRLRVHLANLLAQENTRTTLERRLREHVADGEGVKPELVKLRSPTFNPRGFRVELAAPATANDSGEVALSRQSIVPPAVAEDNGVVTFDLLPENIAALQTANAEPVLLRGAYLKLSGQMKARFEKQQFLVNFQVVQTAVASLQHDLQSIQPTGQPAPEVFVQIPAGGTVEGKTAVAAAFSQYLVGSISVREGANVNLGLVNELAERVLGRVLSQIELKQMEDGKRVAVMLGDRATLSATVGEIKALAKETKAEREDKLKAALDDMEARRTGQKSEYNGSVAAQFGPIGGKVEAAYANASDEEKTARRKQELETLNLGLDELAKRFDGRLPTLSGLQFDQKAFDESVKAIQVELQQSSFTTGWSQHEWAGIKLTTTAGLAVSPELLLRQADEAKARYAAFDQLLGTPEKVKELQELLRNARKATEQAKATADRVAEMEKQGTTAEAEERLGKLETSLSSSKEALAKLEARAAWRLPRFTGRLKHDNGWVLESSVMRLSYPGDDALSDARVTVNGDDTLPWDVPLGSMVTVTYDMSGKVTTVDAHYAVPPPEGGARTPPDDTVYEGKCSKIEGVTFAFSREREAAISRYTKVGFAPPIRDNTSLSDAKLTWKDCSAATARVTIPYFCDVDVDGKRMWVGPTDANAFFKAADGKTIRIEVSGVDGRIDLIAVMPK